VNKRSPGNSLAHLYLTAGRLIGEDGLFATLSFLLENTRLEQLTRLARLVDKTNVNLSA
tara:strand:+ start:459 stop:635 length:177 start_codon:yes stop_codon:yes gene_type:complete